MEGVDISSFSGRREEASLPVLGTVATGEGRKPFVLVCPAALGADGMRARTSAAARSSVCAGAGAAKWSRGNTTAPTLANTPRPLWYSAPKDEDSGEIVDRTGGGGAGTGSSFHDPGSPGSFNDTCGLLSIAAVLRECSDWIGPGARAGRGMACEEALIGGGRLNGSADGTADGPGAPLLIAGCCCCCCEGCISRMLASCAERIPCSCGGGTEAARAG